eukprot:tig00000042_g15585.t1
MRAIHFSSDVRLWSVERSAEEIAASYEYRPVSTYGLELYLPLASGLEDESGRGRHGVLEPANGALTFVARPDTVRPAHTPPA